jgi:hypothetical protein
MCRSPCALAENGAKIWLQPSPPPKNSAHIVNYIYNLMAQIKQKVSGSESRRIFSMGVHKEGTSKVTSVLVMFLK